MGTGKSTVSKALQEITMFQEIDTDMEISKQENSSIPELFEKYGEGYFRELETQFLKKMNQTQHCIISCGGGMVLKEENIRLMKKNGIVILLTATAKTVLERVESGKDRPILKDHMNVEYIENLMAKREEHYKKAQELIISTDERTPEEISEEILKELNSIHFSFDF